MKRPIVIVLLTLALVFVLAGIAAVLFFFWGVGGGFPTNNPFDQRNISSSLEESKTLEVDTSKPVTLKVTDDAGEVTITGADVDAVQVKVVKTAFDSTQARADEEVKTIQYSIDQADNTITLNYKINDSMNFSNKINTVDFIITVPNDVKVDVKGNIGEVNISNTRGDIVVKNDFGNITVTNIDGALSLGTNSGSLNISSVQAGSGDIEIFSGFGSATIEQVSGGNITIGSDSGTLELKNVRAAKEMKLSTKFGNIKFATGTAGSLDAETSSGSVTLTSITVKGDLTIKDDFGDIDLEQVKSTSYDIETNSGSITVNGAKGRVRAHTGFGNIEIKNAEDATLDLNTKSGSIEFSGALGDGPHAVHSDFGDVKLNLPADTAININMETKFGKITSDLPITVTLTGDVTEGQQNGTINGGGAEFKVDTNSGNISLKILK
ncbi:MAG: hypothetical protein C3F07_11370 [Anaerolineales bacterium]|nr:DUF4097 domain-containing protein [Anaerolineae bacterium]PWB72649.1 MAG: hypothetical protein C3F07_11370 [Anaerolineales bacterium]